MGDGGYLTIEETARKLGMPASWVKGQICEGKLGATLSGRRWLIPAQESDKLLRDEPPARISEEPVPNFLNRPAGKARSTPKAQKRSSRTRGDQPARSAKGSLPPAGSRRSEKSGGTRSPLTQKIGKLDREFERLTVRLRAVMIEYRAADGMGKKVRPPGNLLQKWKAAKAELKYLVANAEAKGLPLPSGLTIHRILAQEAETVKRRTAPRNSQAPRKAKPATGGIVGYSGGALHRREQEARRMPADVEARLIILRSRERNAAHAMRDRGRDQASRNAAQIRWAEARREAERLEREFGPVRRPD